jgi:Ni,Fe-hydrogenase III small subunit
MNPLRLLRVIRTAGRVAEPAPSLSTASTPAGTRPVGPALLAGSVQVRHVDAGSCNGCEIEVGAAFGPVYDAERYGARLVASPRHADLLLVTGVVTHNMAEPLRRTVEATPRPHVVVAVGDCARTCGAVAGGHGVAGAVGDVVAVDLEVPGCPPEPEAIVAALRQVTRR